LLFVRQNAASSQIWFDKKCTLKKIQECFCNLQGGKIRQVSESPTCRCKEIQNKHFFLTFFSLLIKNYKLVEKLREDYEKLDEKT